MAYEYVNIRTDTIDNVKVPTKETLDARTIIESTLEPSTGTAALEHYSIGIWQFPKTGFYKIKLSQLGTNITFLHLYARKTKDDGTLPEDDFSNDNLVMTSGAGGDGQLEYIYILADYLDTDSLTAYKIQFLNPILRQGITWVNTYDKTTQKWSFISAANVNAKNVSNTLTLTKGDTTTVYDGSVAREVSIPTKTSELTNDSFVSYTEQALTKDQQNQAKTNLGIDILTGNTTTVTPIQVKEAILAGRSVAINYTDTTYGNLTFTSFGYSLENNIVVANLITISNGKYILADLVGMSSYDQWHLHITEIGTSVDIADKLQYKGNWQSNTTYNKNDVVYDETDLMYVYTETDATSDPPDINPNCQPLVNIATNVKKGTLGVPNASTIYNQFNYLIDASTTDSGKYLTVNSEGNPEWGTVTAPEESVVIAKLTGAGTTASPYACDKTYNELYTAILAGKYVLMYDNTTKRMLSPYFINIQARLLQFQHVLCEQTGSTATTLKLTVIAVNYNGGSNTLTRTVYSNNIVSSVNGKTGNVIKLSASDVGAASSEDLNTLKNSIPEISVVTLDD